MWIELTEGVGGQTKLSPSLKGRTPLGAGEEAQAPPGPGASGQVVGQWFGPGSVWGRGRGVLRRRCALRLPGEQKAPTPHPAASALQGGAAPTVAWHPGFSGGCVTGGSQTACSRTTWLRSCVLDKLPEVRASV